ncbi:MAG TPA: DUF6538 domain-containing protein [Reyranella sp.]|jgi:integrase|nr:DUF6538 domain-containing protein [Reyranella sp.]
MKMALPRGMYPHPKTGVYWARKDVPKDLQKLIGKTSLKQTLGTKDANQARSAFHAVMKRFEDQIATAKKAYAAGTSMPVDYSNVVIEIEPQFQAGMRAIYENSPQGQIAKMREELVQAGLSKPKKDPVSLDELFARWKIEKKPKKNSEAEYLRAKDLFKQLNTDKPIAEYTTADARTFKDAILVKTKPDGDPLSHATRVKWFGSVKTLFKLADDDDLLTENPFEKIKLERPRRAKASKREDWEQDELEKLFGSPVYAEGKRPRGGAGEAAYWLPVLALYHGYRAGELAQLDKADVVKRSKVWCLAIRPSEDDQAEDAKSVKTDTSVRVVPIHSAVIALGFLDYVDAVKGKKLFPKIKQDSIGRWAGNWGKWFGRYRTSIGLGARWKDFHSFRATWKTAARGAYIPEEIHDEITGHDTGSVGRGYGKVPIPVLVDALEKIAFDVAIPKWKG